MTLVSYKITGKALTLKDMETVLPGSAKTVAYGLQEVRRLIRAASRAADAQEQR